jgi:hypothetical protein
MKISGFIAVTAHSVSLVTSVFCARILLLSTEKGAVA